MAKKKIKRIPIAKHGLIPKHEKLSDKEKHQLLEKYQISLRELPKMLVDDPGIQKVNAKPGDIIKIIRKSQTAGESFFYRCVTNV